MNFKRFLIPLLALSILPGIASCSESWKDIEKSDCERVLNDAYFITYNSDFVLNKTFSKDNQEQSSYVYEHSFSTSSCLTRSYSVEDGTSKLQRKNFLEKKGNGYLISYDYVSEDSKKTVYYNDVKNRSINDFFPAEIRKSNFSFRSINGKRSSSGNYSIKLMRSDETILDFSIRDFGISEITGTKGTEKEKYVFTYQQVNDISFLDSEKELFDIKFLRDESLLQEKDVVAGNEMEYTGNQTALEGTPELPFSGWSEDTDVAYKDTDLLAIYGEDFPEYTINFFTLSDGEYKLFQKYNITRGENFTLPTAPPYDGRKFIGWSRNVDFNENDTLYKGITNARSNSSYYARYETNASQYAAIFHWNYENLRGDWTVWINKGKSLRESGIDKITPLVQKLGNVYYCESAEVNNKYYSPFSKVFDVKWTESDYGSANILNINVKIAKRSANAKTLVLYYAATKIATYSVEPEDSIATYLAEAEEYVHSNYDKTVMVWANSAGTKILKAKDYPSMPNEDLTLSAICGPGNSPRLLSKFRNVNLLSLTAEDNFDNPIKSTLMQKVTQSDETIHFGESYKNEYTSYFGASNLNSDANEVLSYCDSSGNFDNFYSIFPSNMSERSSQIKNGSIFSLKDNSASISIAEYYNYLYENIDMAYFINNSQITSSDFNRELASIVALNFNLCFNTTTTVLRFETTKNSKSASANEVVIQRRLDLDKSYVDISWLDLENVNVSTSALFSFKTKRETFLNGIDLARRSYELGSNEDLSSIGAIDTYMTLKEQFSAIRKDSTITIASAGASNSNYNLFRLGSNQILFALSKGTMSHSLNTTEYLAPLEGASYCLPVTRTLKDLSMKTYYSGTKKSYPEPRPQFYQVDTKPYGNGSWSEPNNLISNCYFIFKYSAPKDDVSLGDRIKLVNYASATLTIECGGDGKAGGTVYDSNSYAWSQNGHQIINSNYADYLYQHNGERLVW